MFVEENSNNNKSNVCVIAERDERKKSLNLFAAIIITSHIANDRLLSQHEVWH